MGYRTYTCPISRRCGGCEWLAIPYPIQLKRKQAGMEELFAGVCKRDGCTVRPIRGIDDPRAFRCKAASPYAPGANGRIRSGFYEGGTHRIVSCQECLVEDGRARTLLNDVARVAERLHIEAYREDRGEGVLRHAVVRCSHATRDVMLVVVTNGDTLPHRERFVQMLRGRHLELTTIVQNINTRRTNAMLGRRCVTLWGPGTIRDSLLGCDFEIGPTSFYQTNPTQTEVLYQLAIEGAEVSDGERVLDAYCGCGTIGLCLAHDARTRGIEGVSVVDVEQVGGAIRNARRNASINELAESCSFVQADATAYMHEVAQGRPRTGSFDTVIMDPPRAGSTPEFIDGVAALSPKRVIYVSCNPTTQVRDLDAFSHRGYHARSIEPVDMFPHTKHVETVVTLSGKE